MRKINWLLFNLIYWWSSLMACCSPRLFWPFLDPAASMCTPHYCRAGEVLRPFSGRYSLVTENRV
jgi:hypothetical protein